jgi:dTDP-4-amino-4,6-dideoxygalactose transaminase
LIALGIGKGDEVIVPAFSYIATANVVELVGAKPVFIDIDNKSFNIDKNLIEQAITPNTKAIIPVHEFGLACDIAIICELAKKYDLKVIEDAACALGATENGKFTGTFGHVGSFSFHPRKAITSGEGGMLVTNDNELARELYILRNHGVEMQNGKIEFVEAGYNYRLTDFQAALVNSQFQRIEYILDYKNKLAQNYFEEFRNITKIQLPEFPITKRHTWQSFHIVLDDSVNRNECIETMKKLGVGTNYGAQCIPFQKYYQEKYKLDCESLFPNSLRAYKQGLVLPLYNALLFDEIHQISAFVKNIIVNLHA